MWKYVDSDSSIDDVKLLISLFKYYSNNKRESCALIE